MYDFNFDSAARLITIVVERSLSHAEAADLAQRFRRTVDSLEGEPFSVLIDVSGMAFIPPHPKAVIQSLELYGIDKGMKRIAFVERHWVQRLQMKGLCKALHQAKREGHFKNLREAMRFLEE